MCHRITWEAQGEKKEPLLNASLLFPKRKYNGSYADHNYAVINLLVSSVLPWIYSIVTSLTVFLGVLLPRNCIFSPRHTQGTSLCIVTQQVVCLLKIKHKDTACPIPASFNEYTLFIQGWEQICGSNWHLVVLANLLFWFWSYWANAWGFCLVIWQTNPLASTWGLPVWELSHKAIGLEGVTKCPPPIPQQDSTIDTYV